MRRAWMLLVLIVPPFTALTFGAAYTAPLQQGGQLAWHWLEPAVQVVNLDNITSTTGFVDVDVTDITSSTTSFVMLRIYAAGGYGSTNNTWINTRKNGQADSGVSFIIVPSDIDWVPTQQMLIVAVDANQVFEYKLDPGTGAAIYLDYFVHAYMDEIAPTATVTLTATTTPAVVGTPHFTSDISYGDLGKQGVLAAILVVLVIGFLSWLIIQLGGTRRKS